MAAHSNGQFVEPWILRVRDVDDDMLAGLLRSLLLLRRLKFAVAAGAAVLGGLLFGVLNLDDATYALLIYATLAGVCALPVFAGGTLAVRRLFRIEAESQGIARSASTLILTRAERRARFLAPWRAEDTKIELLMEAVREPDRA